MGQFSANVGLGAADLPSDRYIGWHGSPINGINDLELAVFGQYIF